MSLNGYSVGQNDQQIFKTVHGWFPRLQCHSKQTRIFGNEIFRLVEADDHFERLIKRQIKTGETAGLADAGREFISALSEIAWAGYEIEQKDERADAC